MELNRAGSVGLGRGPPSSQRGDQNEGPLLPPLSFTHLLVHSFSTPKELGCSLT